MKKSSRSRRIIKADEIDEGRLGKFCLISVLDEQQSDSEKISEEEVKEVSESVKESSKIKLDLEEEVKRKLDQARKEGFEKGYKEGFEAGRKEGYEKGRQEGINQGRKEGFDKGFKDGFDRGFEEGKAEARRVIEERYNSILDRAAESIETLCDLQREFRERLRLIEDLAVSVVCTAMKKLFFVVPEEEVVANTVRELLDRVAEGQKVKLKLNPKDYDVIKERLSLPDTVSVATDSSLKRGACVVETTTGVIETSVEERLREFEELVLSKWRGEESSLS